MTSDEKKRMVEIEARLLKLKYQFEALMPIYTQLDRAKKNLEVQVASLENERIKLLEGQLPFRFEKADL